MNKRFKVTRMLAMIFNGIITDDTGLTKRDALSLRNHLLTNGGKAPIPQRMLNQRQRRKLQRQTKTH